MRLPRLLVSLCALLPLLAFADTTVTVTVTAAPSRDITKFVTITTDSIPIGAATAAAAPAAPAATSIASVPPASQDPNTPPQGDNRSGNHVDSSAGAAGPDSGGGSISRGGIIAIGVICGLAVVIIIPLTVLFVLAKRRGWQVRQSLRRVSRRLTGRFDTAQARRKSRHNGGVRMASPPRSARTRAGAGAEAQAKAQARMDARETGGVRDVEKGEKPEKTERPKPLEKMGSTTTVASTFDVETPVVKSWRTKLGVGRR